jgi:hypothetical protein
VINFDAVLVHHFLFGTVAVRLPAISLRRLWSWRDGERLAGNGGALAPVRYFSRHRHERGKAKQEASPLTFLFYRRPRSCRVNITPLRDVPHQARLRSARLGGTGPLGRKAWPRVPRNPAPLARKPPMLTRHEGRRSR